MKRKQHRLFCCFTGFKVLPVSGQLGFIFRSLLYQLCKWKVYYNHWCKPLGQTAKVQTCCYILTSQRCLITTELWFFWFSSTPLHSPSVGSVRGKHWIYLYCCTCKKSSELETTTIFPLAWVTLFQKRARNKGTFVCVKCGRLQSRFPCRHLQLRWAEIIHKSHFPLSQAISRAS